MSPEEYIARAAELCGDRRYAEYLAFADRYLAEILPLLQADQLDYIFALGETAADVVDAQERLDAARRA
jgi:hypothetical protein